MADLYILRLTPFVFLDRVILHVELTVTEGDQPVWSGAFALLTNAETKRAAPCPVLSPRQ
jgi:hypothetical protein